METTLDKVTLNNSCPFDLLDSVLFVPIAEIKQLRPREKREEGVV